MDHVDVEAVALNKNAGHDLESDEDAEAQGRRISHPMNQTLLEERKQQETLHRMAQAMTDILVRCLKTLMQEDVRMPEGSIEVLVSQSSEGDATAGAPNPIPELQSKCELGHESIHEEEKPQDSQKFKQGSKNSVLEGAVAPIIENGNGSSQENPDQKNDPQDPPQSCKPVLEYTRRVAKMSEKDIKAENEGRRIFREKWRVGQDTSYLEDSWQHLWRRNRSDAEPLFCGCTDEERKGLQLDLIDALYFIPNANNFRLIPWRGLRTLSCWPPGLVKDDDLEAVWLKPISVVERALRHNQQPTAFDAGRVPLVTVSDFNLNNLQEIGKLKIRWTSYWDEHLKLETNRFTTILRLYWFPTGLSEIHSKAGLCAGLDEDDRIQRMEEILLTLNMLLTSSCHPKDLRKRYGRLEAPTWLSLLGHDKLKNTWNPESGLHTTSVPSLSSFWQDDSEMTRFCYEMTDHLRLPPPDRRDFRRVTYDEYPVYYQRL
ncbi:MAG: hypothetical protein Q9198_000920 [Flavoplaca austrocitrina]